MSTLNGGTSKSLLQSISLLPREVVDRIFHYLQLTAKQSELLTLIQVSRKTYDKCLPLLYKSVKLNSRNAAQFFHGLGPRFGGELPSQGRLDEVHALFEEEMEEKRSRVSQKEEEEEAEQSKLALDGGEEEWLKWQRESQDIEREREVELAFPYVRYSPLTTSFIRKFYAIHYLVQSLFIEDPESCLLMVEAGEVVSRPQAGEEEGGEGDEGAEGQDGQRDPPPLQRLGTAPRLFDNVLSLSLGPQLLERLDQVSYAWEPLLERMITMASAHEICIRLPTISVGQNDAVSGSQQQCATTQRSIQARTWRTLFNIMVDFLDEDELYFRHVTVHNVDLRIVKILRISTDKVRLFLRTRTPPPPKQQQDEEGLGVVLSQDRLAQSQTTAVVRELSRLAAEATVNDPLDFAWDKPEYLNFVPAEDPAFDPEQMFAQHPEVLTNPSTGKKAGFFGREQGDPCQICGGR